MTRSLIMVLSVEMTRSSHIGSLDPRGSFPILGSLASELARYLVMVLLPPMTRSHHVVPTCGMTRTCGMVLSLINDSIIRDGTLNLDDSHLLNGPLAVCDSLPTNGSLERLGCQMVHSFIMARFSSLVLSGVMAICLCSGTACCLYRSPTPTPDSLPSLASKWPSNP